ncbi:MAG: APC family permease, partial [Synergistaceae bacterium]|nr:APC family permease [Synergistaceae bacterium]
MSESKLRKTLTPFSVWSIAFGGVIGWGLMVMPGTTFLKRGGTMGTMLSMEIAAFIMLIMSYNYAYMMRKFPDSGGQFIFAEKAFGRIHGFICAWFLGLCYIMIIPMNATALCLVFRALSEEKSILYFGFHYEVAGYDIYFGEVILAVGALIFFALVSSGRVETAGRMQSFFVIVLLAGTATVLGASIISPASSSANLYPMFYPLDETHGSALSQIISILVLAPWMYVGFDTVPQMVEESSFPPSRAKSIMDTSIIAGCSVYVVLTLVSASGISSGYPDWAAYVNDLPNLRGPSGIATFSAAYNVLGNAGVFAISMAVLMAMFTGMLGFYTATSRVLYSLSR